MVRRGVSADGSLRYREVAMTDQHDADQDDGSRLDPVALSVAATTATGAMGSPGPEEGLDPSRPWTAAAAMEPIPPLAPPPARPGSGTPVALTARSQAGGMGARALVSILLLLVAAAVVIVLVVVLGH
jgi:hypothetical protein